MLCSRLVHLSDRDVAASRKPHRHAGRSRLSLTGALLFDLDVCVFPAIVMACLAAVEAEPIRFWPFSRSQRFGGLRQPGYLPQYHLYHSADGCAYVGPDERS